MAAYSQPGRMPEVNVLTSLPVDRLQNVAAATEQPPVNTAPAVKMSAEQVAAMLRQNEHRPAHFQMRVRIIAPVATHATLGDSEAQVVRMEDTVP